MPHSLEDYRWLATSEATHWFEELVDHLPATPKLVQRLRKSLTNDQTHLLLEQTELRQRALEKFPQAGSMLFTRRGYEQATDHYLARFKAERFPADQPIEDLCCGIGGDALALAARGTCRAVDLDPIMTWLTSFNAEAHGLDTLQTECADVTQLPRGENLWHIDPDRRSDGKRHTRVGGYQPGIEVLEQLVATSRGGAIKLAPAAELPEELRAGAELQWISRAGECKQLVAWYGELATHADCRSAAVLNRQGEVVDQLVAHQDPPLEDFAAERIGRYVFDPDAAMLAGQVVGQLAADRDLRVIDSASSYLTADHLPAEGSLAAFEVIEQLPLDVRRLRQVLEAHRIGRLELKKRGVPVELPWLEKKLRTKGDQTCTVMVTAWEGQIVAIVCRRV